MVTWTLRANLKFLTNSRKYFYNFIQLIYLVFLNVILYRYDSVVNKTASGEVNLFNFNNKNGGKPRRSTKSTDNGKRVTNVSKPRHLVPNSLMPVLEVSKSRAHNMIVSQSKISQISS